MKTQSLDVARHQLETILSLMRDIPRHPAASRDIPRHPATGFS
jgi:hypothetical protein